jgi:hypothetical protein
MEDAECFEGHSVFGVYISWMNSDLVESFGNQKTSPATEGSVSGEGNVKRKEKCV